MPAIPVCETWKQVSHVRVLFPIFSPTLNFLRATRSIDAPCFSVLQPLRLTSLSPTALSFTVFSSPRLFHALSHPLSHLHLILLSRSLSSSLSPASSLLLSLPSPSLWLCRLSQLFSVALWASCGGDRTALQPQRSITRAEQPSEMKRKVDLSFFFFFNEWVEEGERPQTLLNQADWIIRAAGTHWSSFSLLN